jgi:zinc/manganese transport system ATP-binding protein
LPRLALGRTGAATDTSAGLRTVEGQPDRHHRCERLREKQPAEGHRRLEKPLAGKVRLDVPLKGGVSFLPQQQHLDRQFPISLQALVAAGFWGNKQSPVIRSQRLATVLENWCLNGLEDRPLMALSGGELQRALLARLSLTDAPVLLLDEPHAALDELGQALLWKHIHDWHLDGRTLVVVCHDLAAVREHIPHTLLIKSNGCVFGPSAELIRQQPQSQVA